MVIEFSVSNYRSIGKKQTISFVAAKGDDTLPENVITDTNPQLLKSMAVYGPNASGKSNLINALITMRAIVLKSASMEPDTEKPIEQFRLNRQYDNKSTAFEILFIQKGIRYQYGFKTKKTTVEEEWLYAFPNRKGQLWFYRQHNCKRKMPTVEFGSFLKGERKKLESMTRSDSLFLSIAAQFNHPVLTKIYNWFKNELVVVHSSLSSLTYPRTKQILYQSLNDEVISRERTEISRMLSNADLGIHDIKTKVRDIESVSRSLPEEIPDDVKKKLIEEYKNNPHYFIEVETIHKVPNSDEAIVFKLEDESDGTQRFFELIGPWFHGLTNQSTIIIDEIESSLHPLLTRELINLVHRNSKKGPSPQLLFSTHDVTLLSNDLLRRDQIWFIEKNESQESVLTPLTEFSPRKSEAILKGYMSGRYGGIPYLADFGKE